jgi:CheY-like chemotaxis protein
VKRMLERAGLEVLEASDGLQAVEMFQKHESKIRCVLMDYLMPRMNGEDAFDRIRQLRSDACVFLMSGHKDEAFLERMEKKGISGYIAKPFRWAALLDVLRKHVS